MGLLSTTYCTVAEVQRYLSTQAVTDFADNDQDGSADTDVVEDCINEATQEIEFYCRQRYTPAILATSELVTRWCVVMASKVLMERRGNPASASLAAAYDRITDPDDGFLARVADGKRQLPGLALRDAMRPTWSNVTIDRRHHRSVVRVTDTNSSDAPSKLDRDTIIETPGQFE